MNVFHIPYIGQNIFSTNTNRNAQKEAELKNEDSISKVQLHLQGTAEEDVPWMLASQGIT